MNGVSSSQVRGQSQTWRASPATLPRRNWPPPSRPGLARPHCSRPSTGPARHRTVWWAATWSGSRRRPSVIRQRRRAAQPRRRSHPNLAAGRGHPRGHERGDGDRKALGLRPVPAAARSARAKAVCALGLAGARNARGRHRAPGVGQGDRARVGRLGAPGGLDSRGQGVCGHTSPSQSNRRPGCQVPERPHPARPHATGRATSKMVEKIHFQSLSASRPSACNAPARPSGLLLVIALSQLHAFKVEMFRCGPTTLNHSSSRP